MPPTKDGAGFLQGTNVVYSSQHVFLENVMIIQAAYRQSIKPRAQTDTGESNAEASVVIVFIFLRDCFPDRRITSITLDIKEDYSRLLTSRRSNVADK